MTSVNESERRKSLVVGDDVAGDDVDSGDNIGEEDEDEPFVGRAQYLSTNLILITNYNGDTQSVVEDHFSR